MIRSIVIIVVMVLINFAMIFAIFTMANRTNNNMRKFFLDNAGDFFRDASIEYKKESKVEEKIVEVEKVTPVYQFNESKTADYKYTNFKNDYKSLKFELDKNLSKEDIILDLIETNGSNKNDKFANQIFKINEEFDFDTLYELSTLTAQQQLKVLNDVFDEKQIEFLDDYIDKLENKEFNIIEFFNYVHDQAKLLDEKFYVKTGWAEENFDELNKKVVTVHDKEIAEGIKVVHKNKMYDYSI